jgi:hypothetical protein
MRGIAASVVIVMSSAGVLAADTPARPFKLEANKPVEIVCATKSVVVATDAANASNGEIKLSLLLKDPTAKPTNGSWQAVSADQGHASSFAAQKHQGKACAEACPLTATDEQIQMWAPAPKGVDQLAEGEVLLLAILKIASMELRASTFNGKQIEALETGTCTARTSRSETK